MKKALTEVLCLCMLLLSACATENSNRKVVPNREKPIIWFNTQPANSVTGELEMDALGFNDKTMYVGNDSHQGGELQGQMVYDYLQSEGQSVDRNGDGIIGYVLLIGDIGHDDSINRTRGTRKVLGTGTPDSLQGLTKINDLDDVNFQPIGVNLKGTSKVVQDGSLVLDGKEYIIRELASQEMRSISGATWDAATAANIFDTWSTSFGDQIDMVISNNDNMGMAVFNSWARKNKVPIFGYDADSDCVAAIPDGFTGTISQNVDTQAYILMHLLRNGIDDADFRTGIEFPDEAGNVLTPDMYVYRSEERSIYATNSIVNIDNYTDYLDSGRPNPLYSNPLDKESSVTRRIWIDFPNGGSFFWNGTFASQIDNSAKVLNLDYQLILGDGLTESSIVDRLVNPQDYDGFGIVVIRKDNSSAYLSRFR